LARDLHVFRLVFEFQVFEFQVYEVQVSCLLVTLSGVNVWQVFLL
jgi:hypothetical protein